MTCSDCGAELGVGRFCTNCGAPIAADERAAWAAERDERLADAAPEVPAEPPSAGGSAAESSGAEPSGADPDRAEPDRAQSVDPDREAAEPAAVPTPRASSRARAAAPDRSASRSRTSSSGRRPSHRVEVIVLALLVLGALLLATRDGDDDDPERMAATAASPDGRSTPPDLTAAEISAPPAIAPSRSLAGDLVRYQTSNLTDRETSTAYRTRGDASGETIRFTFPQESLVTEVGLVNGYAKTDSFDGRAVDWYAANRKVLRVAWTFDDGSEVVQDLRIGPDLQTIDVPPVWTQTVELRLLEVSPPGDGPRGRDTTAISEVLIR